MPVAVEMNTGKQRSRPHINVELPLLLSVRIAISLIEKLVD